MPISRVHHLGTMNVLETSLTLKRNKDEKHILTSVLVRIFCLHKYNKTRTHTHTNTFFRPDKNSHSPHCVIPSDLADIVLLEASSHSAASPGAAFELGCQESVTPRASFFDFLE